jgi:hypothetical protein
MELFFWELGMPLAQRHSCAHNVVERSAQGNVSHMPFRSVTHVFGPSVMHVQATCARK